MCSSTVSIYVCASEHPVPAFEAFLHMSRGHLSLFCTALLYSPQFGGNSKCTLAGWHLNHHHSHCEQPQNLPPARDLHHLPCRLEPAATGVLLLCHHLPQAGDAYLGAGTHLHHQRFVSHGNCTGQGEPSSFAAIQTAVIVDACVCAWRTLTVSTSSIQCTKFSSNA